MPMAAGPRTPCVDFYLALTACVRADRTAHLSEFVVLLVGADEAAAMAAVERIRDAIASVGPPRVPERAGQCEPCLDVEDGIGATRRAR